MAPILEAQARPADIHDADDNLFPYAYDAGDPLIGLASEARDSLALSGPRSASRCTVFTYDTTADHSPYAGPDTACANPETIYVFGSYIDEVLCMVKPDNSRYFFSANDLYSTYALTDATGNVVERYMYDPYGKGESVLAQPAREVWTASGFPSQPDSNRLMERHEMVYLRRKVTR